MQARLAAGVAWGCGALSQPKSGFVSHSPAPRYGPRAQMTTARNLNDYAAMVDALVSQPKLLREYRQYAALDLFGAIILQPFTGICLGSRTNKCRSLTPSPGCTISVR